MSSPIIEVAHLVKRYKHAAVNAVDDVSFSVEPGQLFALLGPNGAGKTTTVSILTTTLLPSSGDVRIAGFDVVREASEVRQRVGIIFQQPSLDLNLTAEENIRFHAVLYGLYPFRPTFSLMPREYRTRVRDLASVLGIEADLGKPVRTYSGGMKRKLEIVRSLMHRPGVLFLDEPTTGLDPLSRRSLWQYLARVRAEHSTTVLLTTHYLEEAETADAICIVNKGSVVAYGTPAAVKAQLVEEYLLLDAADRAALEAELRDRGLTFDGSGPFKLPLNGRTVHTIVKAIDTPLTLLRPHTPTLEDAYLEVLAQ